MAKVKDPTPKAKVKAKAKAAADKKPSKPEAKKTKKEAAEKLIVSKDTVAVPNITRILTKFFCESEKMSVLRGTCLAVNTDD